MARFKRAAPYADDAMNLPVRDVDAAIPYYETTFGFRVVSRSDAPQRAVVFERDDIQIGLAENGGDPEQEGCFFEVDNVDAASRKYVARRRRKLISGSTSSATRCIEFSSWWHPMGCAI